MCEDSGRGGALPAPCLAALYGAYLMAGDAGRRTQFLAALGHAPRDLMHRARTAWLDSLPRMSLTVVQDMGSRLRRLFPQAGLQVDATTEDGQLPIQLLLHWPHPPTHASSQTPLSQPPLSNTATTPGSSAAPAAAAILVVGPEEAAANDVTLGSTRYQAYSQALTRRGVTLVPIHYLDWLMATDPDAAAQQLRLRDDLYFTGKHLLHETLARHPYEAAVHAVAGLDELMANLRKLDRQAETKADGPTDADLGSGERRAQQQPIATPSAAPNRPRPPGRYWAQQQTSPGDATGSASGAHADEFRSKSGRGSDWDARVQSSTDEAAAQVPAAREVQMRRTAGNPDALIQQQLHAKGFRV
ncbi:hypothetical protein V8C86DRAFT_3017888 [Haematococcus lacustris]